MQHPVSALLDLISAEGLKADVLLVPGDMSNRIDAQGLITGWAFTREIAQALGAAIIAPTLGNHDVISRKPSDDPFSLARSLYPPFPVSDGSAANEFWAQGFCCLESDRFRVLIINSAACHNNEESAKRGVISFKQLEQIRELLSRAPAKEFQVAVSHHHPMLHEDIGLGTSDVMENGSLLLECVAELGFDIFVHGHKHHPKLSYAPGARTLPVLAAGSFSASMKGGLATRTRNVFHVVRLQGPSNAGRVGIVETWQFQHSRGWTAASQHAVDFPHVTGFGCSAPPEQISAELERAFRALNTPLARWGQIADRVQNVRYIPPSIFRAVGEDLLRRRIQLSPAPPDWPIHIGVV